MGRHERPQQQLQMLYLGTSAEVGTLRRSMEAHGAVTRTRLNPAVDAVVADATVSADHPTVQDAQRLGIAVLSPDEAVRRFASSWMTPTDLRRQPSDGHRPGWPFRSSSR